MTDNEPRNPSGRARVAAAPRRSSSNRAYQSADASVNPDLERLVHTAAKGEAGYQGVDARKAAQSARKQNVQQALETGRYAVEDESDINESPLRVQANQLLSEERVSPGQQLFNTVFGDDVSSLTPEEVQNRREVWFTLMDAQKRQAEGESARLLEAEDAADRKAEREWLRWQRNQVMNPGPLSLEQQAANSVFARTIRENSPKDPNAPESAEDEMLRLLSQSGLKDARVAAGLTASGDEFNFDRSSLKTAAGNIERTIPGRSEFAEGYNSTFGGSSDREEAMFANYAGENSDSLVDEIKDIEGSTDGSKWLSEAMDVVESALQNDSSASQVERDLERLVALSGDDVPPEAIAIVMNMYGIERIR